MLKHSNSGGGRASLVTQGRRKGLVHTVCACVKFTEHFLVEFAGYHHHHVVGPRVCIFHEPPGEAYGLGIFLKIVARQSLVALISLYLPGQQSAFVAVRQLPMLTFRRKILQANSSL